MNKAKVVGGFIAAVLLTVTMAGCSDNDPEVIQPQYTTVPVECGDVIRTVYVPGELVLTDTLTVSSPVDSELLELLVKPGEKVNTGQVLAKLDASEWEKQLEEQFEEQLKELEDQLRAAERALATKLRSLLQAEINLTNAEIALYDAQSKWYTMSPTALKIKEKQVEIAEMQLEEAQNAVADAEQAIADAQRDVEDAQEALDEALNTSLEITAPCDGVVLDVKYREGDKVTKDSPIIVLADLSQMELRVTIGQDNIISIRPGMSAEINLDALPGKTLKGKVDYMVPQKSATSQTVTYEVYLGLDELDNGLLPGMTGGATILVAEKHDVLRIPRRLVKIAPDGSGRVEVLEQGQPMFREVVIGVRGDTHYEIVSGLSEGDLAIQRGRF